MNGKTFRDALKEASFILEPIENPVREAVLLLAYIISEDVGKVYAFPERVMDQREYLNFIRCCHKRAEGVPFQYITGKAEFYSMEFNVSSDVLIPRPETELLVEIGLDYLRNLPGEGPFRVLDMCTGSGCIAVAIASNFKNCHVVAADISSNALEIARSNVLKYRLDNRISLIQSDLFHEIDGKFDLILSNPPYIPEKDIFGLQIEVKDYEPKLALIGGMDGLDFYRRLAADGPKKLRTSGAIGVELGIGQAKQVMELFEGQYAYNFSRSFKNCDMPNVFKASIYKDYSGIERVIFLTINCIQ